MGESIGGSTQPYKYNGKELDRTNGLDWCDYGARWYDATRTGWTSVDPHCEKYYDTSPYVYCEDNPVKYIDPNGKEKLEFLSPMNPPTNRNLLLDYKYFNDDPNIINIWAHGNPDGMYKFDNKITTVKNFEKDFLSSSKLWNQHQENGNDVIIVLHSCHTGDETTGESFARQLSKELKGATIIAPTENVNVSTTITKYIGTETDSKGNNYRIGYGHIVKTYVGDDNGPKGSWSEYKDGEIRGSYNSESKPGAIDGISFMDRVYNFLK